MKNKLKLEDMPSKVAFVLGAKYSQTPISFEMYESALKEYPEWFPEEIERRRRWDAIPKDEKDEYYSLSKEWSLPTDGFLSECEEIFGKMPDPDLRGVGIIQRVTTHEHRDWTAHDNWFKKVFELRHKQEGELYDKYFAKYGFKYNDR